MDKPRHPRLTGPCKHAAASGGGRRAFLGGLLAGGLVLPRIASGQDLDWNAEPMPGAQRNISSFRALDWRDFYPTLGKGVILADVSSRALHFWSGDESTYLVFPSSIPMSEELTRRGKTEVVRKAERPSWTPTPSMRERDPTLPQRVEGGAADNPLGIHALYLSWPAYLIHGTHDTRKIGRKSSSGCYGLYNEHIARLYPLVEVGTQVTIF